MTDPRERRKQLYQILSDAGDYDGTLEDFESKFSDKTRISKLYKILYEAEDYTGTEEEFSTKFFDDVLKKKALPTFSEQVQRSLEPIYQESGKPSVAKPVPATTAESEGATTVVPSPNENAPAWRDNPFIDEGYFNGEVKKLNQEKKTKDKAALAERKQKLAEYYDKISSTLDTKDSKDGVRVAYKNWSAETGTLDRYNYMQEKAVNEVRSKREDLATAVTGIKQLQEDRRKAAAEGNMDEYSRLNQLLQSGVEYLRANKKAAENNWQEDPRTETGLRLWEESIGFTSEMLNAKMDKLLSNPETKQRVDRLVAIGEELKKSPNDPKLIEEHNNIITQPDMAEINKLSKHAEGLVRQEKGLAAKFPNVFRDRLEKKDRQRKIDAMFQEGELGLAEGVINQLGRSAVGFVADIIKSPTYFDYDNKYDWQNRWADNVDTFTNYFSDETMPIPSDYNKPLVYKDDNGNSTLRTDLIIPKIARVAGDMAALLYGAGKLSSLGKAAGLSNRVSQGIGLFTSSYVQTYDDYRKSAEAAGMNPDDSAWFATAAAGTTSALELISPNKYLWAKGADDVAKSVAKNIGAGMSRKAALSEAFKTTKKEVFGENIQEISQMVGDIAIEAGTNVLAGNDYFEHNGADVVNEAIETMLLTTIVAGAPAGVTSAAQFAERNKNYKDAIQLVAENRDKYLPLLQQTFKETNATPEQVQRVMDDINGIKIPVDGAPLYKLNGETVERSQIEAQIADENFNGIYIANDPELAKQVKQAFDAFSRPTNQAITASLGYLKKGPKAGIQDNINRLVESGDVSLEGDQVTAKTEKGVKELKTLLRAASNYLKGIPKAKATEAGKEETPEDKAKRVADGKINALVASGDVKYDGKRATALTENGKQQLAAIMNELSRQRLQKAKPEMYSAERERIIEKVNSGEALTNEEANALLQEDEAPTEPAAPAKSQVEEKAVSEAPKQVVKAEETKPDITEKTSSDVETKDETGPFIEGENLDLKNHNLGEEADDIVRVVRKAKKSMSSIVPNLRVAFYRGTKQGKKLFKDATETTTGFYDSAQGLIGIDLDKADTSTAFHEAFHPIVDIIKVEKPEVFQKLTEQAAAMPVRVEDGSYIPYGEYTKGDKKEALIEVLADVADGKFNEDKTVLQKVKSFIRDLLAAIGLKPRDFKIDLDNIDDLKAFADGLSEAISSGRKINFSKKVAQVKNSGVQQQNLGARRKFKEFEKKTGKKVNKTAKRVAEHEATEYKNLQLDILNDLDPYSFNPQKYKDIEQYLESRTDIELYNMLDMNNSMAVLAGIKLMRRYNASGKDTIPIFRKLREIGTSVGQLLRQFGELKTNTSEGIVQMVEGNLESLNVQLSDAQRKLLKIYASNHIKALANADTKKSAYLNNPSPKTETELEEAENALAKSFEKINTFIGMVTPAGLDSIIPLILQGNLLTSKSIVTNTVGNLIQQPGRQVEMLAGDIAVYIASWLKGDPIMNPFRLYFSATLNGMKQSGIGIGKAIQDVIRGRGAEYNSTLEVRRNLKPAQALWQLTFGRKTLPRNAAGQIPLAVQVEKAIEGVGGWTAEGMFRLLYLTDMPFKEGAKIGGAIRLFAEQGGKTSAEFRTFMANLTAKQKQQIQNYAEEATFSDVRFLSEKADDFMKMAGRWVDKTAEYAPNDSTRYMMKALGRTLLKANIPFVRIPSNLVQYLIELTMPIIPLTAAYTYRKRGDVRKAAQLFTRSMMGFSLYYLGNILYDAGVIIPAGDDDDQAERMVKHEVARPASVNLSALKRLRAGLDPTYQTGDDIRDITKLGTLGVYFAINAEWNELVKKEQKKPRKEVSYTEQGISALGSVLKTSLELPFLQGSFEALKAMGSGSFSNYFAELGNTFSALIIPNQYAATFTRPRADYILKADDKKALNELFEKQSVKIFPNLKSNTTGVYPIISMFGEPVDQTPKGENPYIYHLFDITNNEHIQDPMALEIFNLWRRTGEMPISVPSPKMKLDGRTYELTQQDFTYLQMLVGQYRRFELGRAMDDPDPNEKWDAKTDAEKVEKIEQINDDAIEDARNDLMDVLYDGIDNKTILLDSIMGTYKYTNPSEFDFDYAKKMLEESKKPLPY